LPIEIRERLLATQKLTIKLSPIELQNPSSNILNFHHFLQKFGAAIWLMLTGFPQPSAWTTRAASWGRCRGQANCDPLQHAGSGCGGFSMQVFPSPTMDVDVSRRPVLGEFGGHDRADHVGPARRPAHASSPSRR
jgi:hypothetical protein